MLTKPIPMVSKLEGMFLTHIVTTKLVVINTHYVGRWLPPGKDFEIRCIGCLARKSHVEEDRSVDNLVSAKPCVTVFLVLRGIRCKSLL